MKKKDIKNVLSSYDKVNELKTLVNYTKEKSFSSVYDKAEELWLPRLDDFEEEMNILKDEIREARFYYDEALEDKKLCSHDVRIVAAEDDGPSFCLNPTHRCALCGDVINDGYSWYLSDDRNDYTVTIKDKNQFDGDYWYIYDKGLDRSEVINYILSFLDKYDDYDEVDLVKEFSLLDLKKDITFNKKKRIPNDYVLIIGGSNKEKLYDNFYIDRKLDNGSYDFLEYFGNLFNTKVALLDRNETLSKNVFDKYGECRWIIFKEYENLLGLEDLLNGFKNIPFKLILDLSDLYDYNYQDNSLTALKYNLDLRSIFPNSKIVKIDNLSKEELLGLKEGLMDYDDYYQRINNEYCSALGKTSYEDVCHTARKFLKKTI